MKCLPHLQRPYERLLKRAQRGVSFPILTCVRYNLNLEGHKWMVNVTSTASSFTREILFAH